VSTFALLNAFLYYDGWDATGDSKSLNLNATAADLDKTNWRSGGWMECQRGAIKGQLTFDGWWNATGTTPAAVDDTAFTGHGSQHVITAGLTETETSPAWIMRMTEGQYQQFGDYGQMMPFSLAATNSDGVGVIRGQLAAAKQSKSATGALGSVCQLGAPTSTQYVYATLHVFSAGTTITVQVQSDDNSGMTTPTTRGTFSAITTAGGTYLTRVAGPFVGEQYWRLNISAITGTFSVAGAIAVQ
jgi:hypothetical protein